MVSGIVIGVREESEFHYCSILKGRKRESLINIIVIKKAMASKID